MPRNCATPNCNRTTNRPNDPETAYAFCPECTRVVLRTGTPPTLQEPVLLRLARAHALPAKEIVA